MVKGAIEKTKQQLADPNSVKLHQEADGRYMIDQKVVPLPQGAAPDKIHFYNDTKDEDHFAATAKAAARDMLKGNLPQNMKEARKEAIVRAVFGDGKKTADADGAGAVEKAAKRPKAVAAHAEGGAQPSQKWTQRHEAAAAQGAMQRSVSRQSVERQVDKLYADYQKKIDRAPSAFQARQLAAERDKKKAEIYAQNRQASAPAVAPSRGPADIRGLAPKKPSQAADAAGGVVADTLKGKGIFGGEKKPVEVRRATAVKPEIRKAIAVEKKQLSSSSMVNGAAAEQPANPAAAPGANDAAPKGAEQPSSQVQPLTPGNVRHGDAF
jgi:hypothetical protein